MKTLTVTVKARSVMQASQLAMDIKDRLKKWEDLTEVDDYVADKLFIFTANLHDDPRGAAYDIDSFLSLLIDDTCGWASTFLDSVKAQAGADTITHDYAAWRKTKPKPNLQVTHHREKGDPYIETD